MGCHTSGKVGVLGIRSERDLRFKIMFGSRVRSAELCSDPIRDPRVIRVSLGALVEMHMGHFGWQRQLVKFLPSAPACF